MNTYCEKENHSCPYLHSHTRASDEFTEFHVLFNHHFFLNEKAWNLPRLCDSDSVSVESDFDMEDVWEAGGDGD